MVARSGVGLLLCALASCVGRLPGTDDVVDAGPLTDAGAGIVDAGVDGGVDGVDAGLEERDAGPDEVDAGPGELDAGPVFAAPLPLDAPPIIFSLAPILIDGRELDVFWESDGERCALDVSVDGAVTSFADLVPESVFRDRVAMLVEDPARVTVTLTCTSEHGVTTAERAVQRAPTPRLSMDPPAFSTTTTVRVCVEEAAGQCTLLVDREGPPVFTHLFTEAGDLQGNLLAKTDVHAGDCMDVVADDGLYAVVTCRAVGAAPLDPNVSFAHPETMTSARITAGGLRETFSVKLEPDLISADGPIAMTIDGQNIDACTIDSETPLLAPGTTLLTLSLGSHVVRCVGNDSDAVTFPLALLPMSAKTVPSALNDPFTPHGALALIRTDVLPETVCQMSLFSTQGQLPAVPGASFSVPMSTLDGHTSQTGVILGCNTSIGSLNTDSIIGYEDDPGCDGGCVLLDETGQIASGCFDQAFSLCGPMLAFHLNPFLVSDVARRSVEPTIEATESTLPARRATTPVAFDPDGHTCSITQDGLDLLVGATGRGFLDLEVQPETQTVVTMTCVPAQDGELATRFVRVRRGRTLFGDIEEDEGGARRLRVVSQYLRECIVSITRPDGEIATRMETDAVIAIPDDALALALRCRDHFGGESTFALDATPPAIRMEADRGGLSMCNDSVEGCTVGNRFTPPATCTGELDDGRRVPRRCGLYRDTVFRTPDSGIGLHAVEEHLPPGGGTTRVAWQVAEAGCRLVQGPLVVADALEPRGEVDVQLTATAVLKLQCPSGAFRDREVTVGPLLLPPFRNSFQFFPTFAWEGFHVQNCRLIEPDGSLLARVDPSEQLLYLPGTTTARLLCDGTDGSTVPPLQLTAQ